MRLFITLLSIIIVFNLSGCAGVPQQPLPLKTDALTTNSKLGIVTTTLPPVDTGFPGANCLLCYATASIANATLTQHTKTLGHEDLPDIKKMLSEKIRKKNTDIIEINEPIDTQKLPDFANTGPNIARRDFSSYKKKYGLDKLLVVEFSFIGILRHYSAYFPTSDPKGHVSGVAYIVNLENNTYDWYQPINVDKSSEGAWDEPPKYPGLTNSYYQAIETSKDILLKPFTE